MTLENNVRACLSSQQIREWIKDGKIITASLDESRIQPSSFDPVLRDEVFILDTQTQGLIRPQPHESIYRTLLQLPGRQRRRVKISEGFELKKGFSYLIPLEERIKLSNKEFVRSSPKSSLGRLFLNTRMLADYNPCFDEINSFYKLNTELDIWLLVQPLAFNVIVHPEISLNQLRFFTGHSTQLSPFEVAEEFKKNPLLHIKVDDNLLSAEPIITDGLQVHLDLSGKHTEGIVALRARHNPIPVDLKKIGEYEVEDYFEPMLKKDKGIAVGRDQYYLIASKEVLTIPPHLNVELKSHSHIGLTGMLHFAGFIDNGFKGDLVFEIRPDELSDIMLNDGMPISKLDVFRTQVPDKLYGTSIGSHYDGQVGPRPAKFFKPFDLSMAARNIQKLSKLVLVQGADILTKHRKSKDGFELLDSEDAYKLIRDIKNGFFHYRFDCESDEVILQPIPYVLIFGPENTIFSYVRSSNIKDYGDRRLFGKHSIGVGGHIAYSDSINPLEECIRRELNEEVEINNLTAEPRLIGTIMAYNTPVDRVHFGLIYVAHASNLVKPKESSIISGRMVNIDELINDSEYSKKYETWSKALIPHLYNLSTNF